MINTLGAPSPEPDSPHAEATPELLDRIAQTLGITPEVRAAIDDTIAMGNWAHEMSTDSMVHKRGGTQEDFDVERPAQPGSPLATYIFAKMRADHPGHMERLRTL